MYRLQTLGGLDLRRDDGSRAASILTHPKRVALLVYLAVARPGSLYRRDSLLGLFWPELDEERARAALRKAVHLLRQSLGQEAIVRQGDDELGVDGDVVWCDAVAAASALAAGRWEEALDLYGGPFLDGLFVDDAPEFEHWLDATRTRLGQGMFEAACRLAEGAETAGDVFTASSWARRAVALLPYDEHGLRLLLRLLDRLGDRAGAVEAYEAFAARFAQEFDEEPASETQALIASIRRPEPPAAPPPTLEATPVRAAPVAPPLSGPAEPGSERAVGREPDRPGSAFPRPRVRPKSLALAAAAALLVTTGWFAVYRSAAPTVAGDDVAVFPFSVRGSPDLEHLGEGMTTLLSTNLNAIGEVRSLDASLLLRTIDAEGAPLGPVQARSMAERLGARFYVTGSVLELGGEIRLSATLYDRRQPGQPQDAVVQGARDDLFTLVDQLTARLVAAHVTDPALSLARVGALTTHSLPALNAWLRGEREYRAGRYHAATDLFTAATHADTTFALAFYRLVSARRWSKASGADAALAKAMRYVDRLPERERQLVRAFSHLQVGQAMEAERLYRTVLATYPDDIEAWEGIGEVLYHWKPMVGGAVATAREAFERVVALEPTHAGALEHLARIAGAQGDAARMREIAGRVAGLDPEAATIPLLALAGRLREPESRERLRRSDAHTLVQTAALLAAYAGDLTTASLVAAELVATDRYNHLPTGTLRVDVARGSGFIVLAGLELAGGRVRAARERLAEARALQPAAALEMEAMIAAFTRAAPSAELDALHHAVATTPVGPVGTPLTLGHDVRRALARPRRELMIALLDARRGDLDGARMQADSLAALAALRPDRASAEDNGARIIRAWVEFEAGRYDEALSVLGEPRMESLLPTAASYPVLLERLLRAELLRALDRPADALDWYASFPDGSGYDYPFTAIAWLRRAEILDRLGRRDEAAHYYGRFAAMWKDADTEYTQLVEHARARAARRR